MVETGDTLFHDASNLGLLAFLGKLIKSYGLIDVHCLSGTEA
jgi:hypothetical protein